MNTLEERQDFFKNADIDQGLADSHGFQVVISAHNEQQFLEENLESVELALRGVKWIMLFGDDASSDNTLKIAKSFAKKTTAEKYEIFSFDKAKNVAEAKNRVIQKLSCFYFLSSDNLLY